MRHRASTARATATVLGCLLLAGCGSTTAGSGTEPGSASTSSTGSGSGSGSGASLDDLVGRILVAETIDSAEHTLVLGTQISLIFKDGSVRLDAGCNTMTGRARIDDGHLVVTSLVGTEMGCAPERMDQDAWLVAWLTGEPRISVVGDTVKLGDDETTAVLTDDEARHLHDDSSTPTDPDSPVSSDD